MSGYVDAGYAVALVTLAGYTTSLLLRERTARRRIEGAPRAASSAGRSEGATPGGSAGPSAGRGGGSGARGAAT